MGFYYRKSMHVGPFRVNLSKSGLGYSIGGRGFRTGVSARGRRYTTFNVPGSGFGYRSSHRGGCAGALLVSALLAAGAGAAAWRVMA
jgi:hypothetical protein